MVAITVILAAVIAAFVLDMGNMSESANAGVDFNENGEYVTVQVIDAGNTDSIYVEAENGSVSDYIQPNATPVDVSDNSDPWTVGDSLTINSNSIADSEDDLNGTEYDGTPPGEIDEGDIVDKITVYGEVGNELQVIATWEA